MHFCMADTASTSLEESEGLTVYRRHKYERRTDGVLESGTAYCRRW